MPSARVAEVVWYVTGRFYAGKAGLLEDVGYFLHLQGIAGELFNGKPSERTAHFTFAAEPFSAMKVFNGPLEIGLDAVGIFSLYYREKPGAKFNDPATFSEGQRIATFERVAVVATAEVAQPSPGISTLSNVFTAKLVESTPFRFHQRRYDLRRLLGDAITQWGVAATEPVKAPRGYTSVVPFVGSAIRVG